MTPDPPADGSLPIVTPPADRPETDARVGGIVLAAGTSSRFGDRNKLLATHEGAPLVRRAVETLLAAALDPVVVVVGYQSDRVRNAIGDLPVAVVRNPDYGSGQATSVRTGIGALDADVDAAVIALGDMPFVDPETIDALVAAYAADVGDALAPAYDGQRGNPVLFDRRYFDALTDVDGDTGGRGVLLESDSAALVSVEDPGVRRDIDEPADL